MDPVLVWHLDIKNWSVVHKIHSRKVENIFFYSDKLFYKVWGGYQMNYMFWAEKR